MIARLWRPPRRLWRAAFAAIQDGIDLPFRLDRDELLSRSAELRSQLTIAWGGSPLNHLADRAGRHRRVAVGLSLLPVPLLTMSGALLVDGGFALFALAHLALAGCSLWTANDLTRWASLVGRRRLPHPSVAGLCIAVAALRLTSPAEFSRDFGSASFFTPAFAVLGTALVVLSIGDRRSDPLLVMAGRIVLIFGAAIAGIVEFVGAASLSVNPLYSVGLIGAGLVLIGMAGFEGRLLCRGLALAKLDRGGI